MSNKDKPEKKPEEKQTTKEETKESLGKQTSFFKDLFDALLGQVITTYVRPAVKKIPRPVLQVMEKASADKILPVLSVGLQTVFSKSKYKWGDKFGDFIAEASAEICRAIKEDAEGKTETAKTETPTGLNADVNRVLFGVPLDEIPALITALAELYQKTSGEARSAKETDQINSLIAKMDALDLFKFLKLPRTDRERYLAVFVKKAAEKTTEQAVKEFKKNIRAAVANFKMVHKELLAPAWKSVRQKAKQAGRKAMILANTCDGKIAKAIKRTATNPLQNWVDKSNRSWLRRFLW